MIQIYTRLHGLVKAYVWSVRKLGLLFYGISFFALLNGSGVMAQTPTDGTMMKSKEACLLLGYDISQFNQYWEGEKLRHNQTIATVHRNTLLPMIAVGIVDKLNIYVGVPYVQSHSSEPNGGKFAGVKGFQDLGLALKYQFLNKKTESGRLTGFATVGFSKPITKYLSDYKPYSLGFGAPELSLRGIVQYQCNAGVYLRAMGGYLKRGVTKAERDYYYNNGSYYSAYMDVPDAVTFNAVAGSRFFKQTLKVELGYLSVQSTSGDDIRPYNGAQWTNKTQSTQANIVAQYYPPMLKGLGILAGHSRVLTGRNEGKMSGFNFGLTLQFNYLK